MNLYAEENLKSISLLIGGEKSMTLQEFISKKEKEDLKIYNLLKDDIEDGIVYQIHREIRGEGKVSVGVFRKFSNLLYAMKDDIEFILAEDDCLKNRCWFEIKKYRLTNGEYKQEMSCAISASEKLLYYQPYCTALKDFKFVLEENVLPPYENGDIIKIKNAPFSDDFYAIYIYDSTRNGNKHIQLCVGEKIGCCKINWLEVTEKADTCPDERINEFSRKIKAGYNDFRIFCKENGIPSCLQPVDIYGKCLSQDE